MTGIGWIDFSSEHRDKVRTVLDLLKNRGVIDELGVGIIRDAFADRMFPGISTIQTRAKYFTLTAHLIQKFIDQGGKQKSLERFLDENERDCRIRLVERHGDERVLGIIGGTFGTDRKRDVVRKPSSVYWNGLQTFGFVAPAVSLSEFGSRLDERKASLAQILRGSSDDEQAAAGDWDGHSPRVTIGEPGEDYWEHLSIQLTAQEAHALRTQITVRCPGSLIGQILLHDDALDQVLQLSDKSGFNEFADLPFIATLQDAALIQAVRHARDFWRIFYGAHIRYNCLLQRNADETTLAEQFEQRWEKWLADMQPFPAGWDTKFMWELISAEGSRVASATRHFVNGWIEETRRGCPDITRCNELVRLQELQNKGSRARLLETNQAGAPSSWIGLSEMEFRLTVVRQILRDIHDAEQQGGGHA